MRKIAATALAMLMLFPNTSVLAKKQELEFQDKPSIARAAPFEGPHHEFVPDLEEIWATTKWTLLRDGRYQKTEPPTLAFWARMVRIGRYGRFCGIQKTTHGQYYFTLFEGVLEETQERWKPNFVLLWTISAITIRTVNTNGGMEAEKVERVPVASPNTELSAANMPAFLETCEMIPELDAAIKAHYQ